LWAPLLVVAGFATVAGCGAHRPPSPAEAPPGAPPESAAVGAPLGYEGLRDSLDSVDATVLAGKRIALDPGHGGFFPGAMGIHGTSEASVNLGVALVLRDLLTAAGVQVFMTRDSNRDFLTPADSSLRADLGDRMRRVAAFDPDLFLSIHHNADASGRHDVNETQTYYKLGDDGPSLEAAQDIHRSLVRNVGIRPHKVVPGNYFVLRNTDAPALLTETSYLTNPGVEDRLALPAAQRIEAEALYLGIARFFARPAPVVERFAAFDDSSDVPDTLFAGAGPRLWARVRGRFDQARIEIDGASVPTVMGNGWVEAHPPALSQGAHEARLVVRLAGVGTARPGLARFQIRRPVARLVAAALPGRAPPAGWMAVRVDARDTLGFPVQEPVSIRVSTSCPCDSVQDRTVETRDGLAWAYVRVAPRARRTAGHRTSVGVRLSVEGRTRPSSHHPAPAVRTALTVTIDTHERTRTALLRAMPGDTALANGPGTLGASPDRDDLTRDGFLVARVDTAGHALVPRIPGYRVWADDSAQAVSGLPARWTTWMSGALRGKKIMIDPEGGGEDASGVGPGGTRGSLLNLELARILAAQLSAVGAEPQLTRNGDASMSDVERVQRSEAYGSDRYLRIGHRAARLGYYFASPGGKRWAQRTSLTFQRVGLPSLTWGEDAQVPLQQVACPALYASPASVADTASEQRLLAPGTLRAEAYALLLGLAHEWAPDASWPVDSLEVRDADQRPVPGALVTLGGALVLETDAAGRVRFARTERGPMLVEVDHPRVRARGVLLDSMRGVVLTGYPPGP
jgi:N-acetylmuramoyl-L-alanine amidase